MHLGQANLGELVGLPLYLLAWYLFFRLLVGLIPPSSGRRSFIALITLLFMLSGLIGVAGTVAQGWQPLWKLLYASFYHAASAAELVIFPLALLTGLGIWGVLSLPGLPAHGTTRRLGARQILLVVAIGLLYEAGMILFAWPPPWLEIPGPA